MYIVLRRFCKQDIFPRQKTIQKHPLTLYRHSSIKVCVFHSLDFLQKSTARSSSILKRSPFEESYKGCKKTFLQLSFWQKELVAIQSPSTAEAHCAQHHHRPIMDILAPWALSCSPPHEVCHILPGVEPWLWRFLNWRWHKWKWYMMLNEYWICIGLPHLTVSMSRPSRWYISQTKLKDFTSTSSIFWSPE